MKTVIITGATSGIGEAMAQYFSKKGCSLILTGRHASRLEQLASQLDSPCLYFAMDLAEPSSILEFKDFVSQQNELPPVDTLINNAGIYTRKPFLQTTIQEWREQFETNLFGIVQLTQALLPLLENNAPGSILNISSTLGLKTVSETSAYSASKAALINLTETLALEFAEKNIRVNCICPGIIKTPIHGFYDEPEDSEVVKMVNSLQPMGVMGAPEHIASAAYFLCQPESNWTTGSILTVDGGIRLA